MYLDIQGFTLSLLGRAQRGLDVSRSGLGTGTIFEEVARWLEVGVPHRQRLFFENVLMLESSRPRTQFAVW